MSQPASRLNDKCEHYSTVIESGSPDTIIGGQPAARVGDLVSGCWRCASRRGMIVKGSKTVFINSKPVARITDDVECGEGDEPPPPGCHGPVTTYGVKPEDNYVNVVFSDDANFITEEEGDEKNPPPPDKPPPRKPASFLDGLSLDIDLGKRIAQKEVSGGANAVEQGELTVIVGG
jgi:uncharacterized Zn-binding protein involved in type VI secretion